VRILAAVAAATVAVSLAVAVSAEAKSKPTIKQGGVYVLYGRGDSVAGVDVHISRTDHKRPTGVYICLQESNWHTPARIRTVGCGAVNSHGERQFAEKEPLTNGERWRVHHPETRALRAYTGPWSYGVVG
jgi:hypothetical protein